MESEPWLDYQGQSIDELIAAAATHRIDSINCAVKTVLTAREHLNREETIVCAVEALQDEVNNGGYHQFFSNSSCRFVPVIEESLAAIGAVDTLELTRAALRILNPDRMTPDAVQAAAGRAVVRLAEDGDDSVMEALNACDRRFYTLPSLDENLFAFIRANAARIRLTAAGA